MNKIYIAIIIILCFLCFHFIGEQNRYKFDYLRSQRVADMNLIDYLSFSGNKISGGLVGHVVFKNESDQPKNGFRQYYEIDVRDYSDGEQWITATSFIATKYDPPREIETLTLELIENTSKSAVLTDEDEAMKFTYMKSDKVMLIDDGVESYLITSNWDYQKLIEDRQSNSD